MRRDKVIAIIANTSWNIYNFRLSLIEAIRDRGYKVIILAPRDRYSKKLERLGFEYIEIEMDNKGSNPFKDIAFTYRLYKILKEIDVDMILGYTIKINIYGSFVAKVLNIPMIATISGLGSAFLRDSFSSKVAIWLYRLALRVPKRVFFQNRDDMRLFIDKGLVREDIASVVGGSGVDSVKFAPRDSQKREDDTVRFLMVARLLRDKGVVEYVEASKILSKERDLIKMEFALMGGFYTLNPSAISEEEVRAWESEGIISYLGERFDVASVMAKYDVIVLPSYREGLSRVLLEASSMAKVIVTTDVVGCRDVVRDGVNGFLVKVKDAYDLAQKMKKVALLSRKRREEMGKMGRKIVLENFTQEIVIDRYLSSIEELLK